MLSRFTIENYRAFARAQSIEIRPLTLFFGWNSGGKSALIRFLPLLVESMREAGPAIWLKGEVGRGANWSDLVCKATGRSVFKFGLNWGDATLSAPLSAPLSAAWEIEGHPDGKWQENRAVYLKAGEFEQHFSPGEAKVKQSGEWAGFPESYPIGSPLESKNRIQLDLRHCLRSLQTDLQWLGGIRSRLARLATFDGGDPSPLKSDGSNVFDHLIAAQQRSTNDPLLQVIEGFFAALGERLVFDNLFENNWRIMLSPIGAPNVKVNLCDTGEGYSQVLPVLAALANARNAGSPSLLCLEQPELHLHTRAQAVLAKTLVDTATSEAKPRLLVETHSEVLLTSVQLAIANGDIAPEAVRVYWVESRSDGTSDAFAVDFDELGRPNNSTLAAAFDEALDLGQKLLEKQMTKNTKAE